MRPWRALGETSGLASVLKPGHLLRRIRHTGCQQRFLSVPAAATVWSLLQRVPRFDHDRTALVCGESGTRLSHRELHQRSLSLAGKLVHDFGYVVGDKLALVLAGNCTESIITQLAAAAAGITVVTATKAEDRALQGCRGLVVSTKVLQGRSPLGLVADEQHPPIVTHQSCQDGAGLLWENVATSTHSLGEGSHMDIALPDVHQDALLAMYGGAKASERAQTQGQLSHLATHTAAQISLSDADRVAVAAPVDSPFGFGSGVLAGRVSPRRPSPPAVSVSCMRLRAQRERERERERRARAHTHTHCERERERERECVCVCVCAFCKTTQL